MGKLGSVQGSVKTAIKKTQNKTKKGLVYFTCHMVEERPQQHAAAVAAAGAHRRVEAAFYALATS